MNEHSLLPLVALATSLVTGTLIFCLAEFRHRTRSALNLGAATITLALVSYMVWEVFHGQTFEFSMPVTREVTFALRVDELSVMFAGLSSLLWLCTTVYAIGYLEGSPNRSRFFGFFSLCVASTLGVALAGNLFTFFIFYEMLTLSTYPLVVHRGTEKALAAGHTYIVYTLSGGAVLLAGIVWLHTLVGDTHFVSGGHFAGQSPEGQWQLVAIFALLILGLGVKAALVPLHGWLPNAMVAPAPVSALLHAVAVVKAGVFGIVRLVYDVFGIEFAAALGVLKPLGWLAALTILYGSLRALQQTDLKRRLAFSTVSQVSYVTLGATLFGPLGTIGGLVHLLHQGLMKITLFFCAGNYAETLGVHRIDELDGAGRRMPWTSLAFTIGAFGMIGVPPLCGFISKWYLGAAALAVDMEWVLWLLVGSTMLNAAYFLPIIHRLWFRPQRREWPREIIFGRHETALLLLLPVMFTAAMVVLVGVLAGMPFSPLSWAQLIAAMEFAR